MQKLHQTHKIWFKVLLLITVCSSFQPNLFGFESIFYFIFTCHWRPRRCSRKAHYPVHRPSFHAKIFSTFSRIVGKIQLLTMDNHDNDYSWHHNRLSFLQNKVRWCAFWVIENFLAHRICFGQGLDKVRTCLLQIVTYMFKILSF